MLRRVFGPRGQIQVEGEPIPALGVLMSQLQMDGQILISNLLHSAARFCFQLLDSLALVAIQIECFGKQKRPKEG